MRKWHFPVDVISAAVPSTSILKASVLWADVKIEHGLIKTQAEHLRVSIFIWMWSVSATINIMMAAVMAEGTTIIENSAKEPHVVDLANFLEQHGEPIS